jgi:hypothetical protein
MNSKELVLMGRNTFLEIKTNKSNDYGITFESSYLVYTCGENNGAYNQKLNSRDGWNYLVIFERNQISSLFISVSIIKTQDFITWYNVQETFNKAGNLLPPELYLNCLVKQSTDYNIQSIQYEGGGVKENGDIILLVSGGVYIGDKIEGNAKVQNNLLRIYKYSNGTWTYKDLKGINYGIEAYWAYDKMYRVHICEEYSYIYFIDSKDNRTLKRITSHDDFETYSINSMLLGNGNYLMGSSSYNSDESNSAVIVIDTITDMFDFDSYSDLVILSSKK